MTPARAPTDHRPIDIATRPIDRIEVPTPARFRRDYEAPRVPVVLRGLAASWPAMERWSLACLRSEHGDLRVTAARVDRGAVVMDDRLGLAHEELTLGAFLDGLREGARDRYVMSPLAALPPELARAAPPPAYCADAPWRDGNLWIGAPGTVSGLHFDVADNLHAVVSGRKRFTLAPPRESAALYPNGPLHGVPNGARVDLEHPDFERFPRLRGARPWAAELEPGDALYIPSLWWHQVRTVGVSVAANFWWASGLRRAAVLTAQWCKRARGVSM